MHMENDHQETGETRDKVYAGGGVIEFAILFAKHKRKTVVMPLVVSTCVAIYSLFLPNVYTAKTVILPPQQGQSSAAAMLGALSGLANGLGSSLGLKSTNDLYVGMIKSRTISDDIISRFDLLKVYEKSSISDARKKLVASTDVGAGKDGLIVVTVDDTDPKRAADLANAYVDELYKLTSTLAVTEASQRRLFFEKQLALTKNSLANAEVALKDTQEKTGIVEIDKQGEAIISAIGELRAKIAAKEVELSAMQTFATSLNPNYVREQRALSSLKSELAKLEKSNRGEGDIFVPVGKVPEVGLEYLRKLRDVKYYETVFELLAKQYELAKIDEAKDTSIIQVMDKAIVPDKKSSPKRALMVIVSAFIAFFVGLLWMIVAEHFTQSMKDPGFSDRFAAFKKSLAWREAKESAATLNN